MARKSKAAKALAEVIASTADRTQTISLKDFIKAQVDADKSREDALKAATEAGYKNARGKPLNAGNVNYLFYGYDKKKKKAKAAPKAESTLADRILESMTFEEKVEALKRLA